MEKETSVYLISPVRQVTEEQAKVIADHAEKLKLAGVKLFNPVEDAPQQDETGFNIVMAELNFMLQAAMENGRVDILWNAGGTPSEGSRVDLGIAFALDLEFKLVAVFNEEEPVGPQIGLEILRELDGEKPLNVIWEIYSELSKIKNNREVVIDWDTEMIGSEQEWQRIRLGLALGCMAINPRLRMKMGRLIGIDPADKKSYVKVIKEIEKIQMDSGSSPE
ncbi:TPA: hypothetical protein DCZ81_04020 [Candidatus Collierbacteria bacterium]|nr:hypothetical protein [Candidatus Collierbacteria bacterium]HCX26023.1 hypothetical protein [Candidatus Collierbacteria bacterium]